MPDIYFTCKACGKCLVANDALAGLTTDCPDCKTGAIIPTIVIVHLCPHCGQKLKFTGELKGEMVDCTSCNGEVSLPGQSRDAIPAAQRERLVAFACPKCNVELEALEETAEELTTCPGCGAQVHLRRRPHLRIGSNFLSPTAGGQPLPPDAPSNQPAPAKWRRRFSLANLLRYGLVDLLLVALMCLPLPALNGHNFVYVLKLSFSGSKPGPSEQAQSEPSGSPSPQPMHSAAWRRGYEAGRSYGKMDRDSGAYSYMNLDSSDQARIAGGYTAGTMAYRDFWDGYRQGYAEKRQLGVPAIP